MGKRQILTSPLNLSFLHLDRKPLKNKTESIELFEVYLIKSTLGGFQALVDFVYIFGRLILGSNGN